MAAEHRLEDVQEVTAGHWTGHCSCGAEWTGGSKDAVREAWEWHGDPFEHLARPDGYVPEHKKAKT